MEEDAMSGFERIVGALITSMSLLLAGASAHAAPGYQWEFGMEMEGLSFAMPKQKTCVPKTSKEPPVTADNEECRILSKKQVGDRFVWKAECKEGLMEGDVTSTATSYHGTLTMTDKSGESTRMKMSGKRLGECDYQDRSAELLAMQKKAEADARKNMAKFCQDSVEKMYLGALASCPKEKPAICKRLGTLDGYKVAIPSAASPELIEKDAQLSAAFKSCALNIRTLLPNLCHQALEDVDTGFILGNCPAEKESLIAEHCVGRKTSSEIAEKYRDFCQRAYIASGSDAASSGSAADKPSAAGGGIDVPADLQQGLKQLKGLFGF
jgi:hypothetical protein